MQYTELRMLPGDKMNQEEYDRFRERSDKISALMGEYLLRGYRMLATCCDKCGTVLLKFRDQGDYCVACKEVDVDTTLSSNEVSQPEEELPPPWPDSRSTLPTTSNVTATSQESRPVDDSNPTNVIVSDSVKVAINSVNDKLVWAIDALKNSSSTEEAIRICELLKTCAETLNALFKVHKIG